MGLRMSILACRTSKLYKREELEGPEKAYEALQSASSSSDRESNTTASISGEQ